MTVAEVIKELQKIEDKAVQVYFDCPKCGAGMLMHKVGTCVLVETKQAQEKR
jgi:predicted RNA-binding Zn-ribbon protein involved in translation (DUF1610 family)